MTKEANQAGNSGSPECGLPLGDSAQPPTAGTTDRSWTRYAWLPIPVLTAAMLILWIVNPPFTYESQKIVIAANFLIGTLASIVIAYLMQKARARADTAEAQVALIAECKRAEEELRRSAHTQECLYRFVEAMHRARTSAEIYNAALDSIKGAVRCDRVSILLFDDSGIMKFVAWRGLSDGYRNAVQGHSPWKKGESSPEPIRMDDLDQVELPNELKAVIKGEGIRALAFIPLVSNGGVVGKFMVYFDKPHCFTEKELALSLTIARQLAFGLDRIRAEERLAASHRDLEARVEQRTAELRETIGELEAFSYSIAHDLRSPLRSLQGFGQYLAEEYADKLDAQGKDYLQRLISSAGRMDRLVRDVLDYSQILRAELPMESVDIRTLLNGIVETYPIFQQDGTRIHIEGTIPPVLGNEAALTQCFSNLLGNAVRFVAPGTKPEVHVWAEPNGDWVRICVKDNGIGIAAAYHEKIFAMFQRLSKTYEGTGMGLAIVKKAAERMGARLGLESAPGAGSTFWLELRKPPLAEPRTTAQSRREATFHSPSLPTSIPNPLMSEP